MEICILHVGDNDYKLPHMSKAKSEHLRVLPRSVLVSDELRNVINSLLIAYFNRMTIIFLGNQTSGMIIIFLGRGNIQFLALAFTSFYQDIVKMVFRPNFKHLFF